MSRDEVRNKLIEVLKKVLEEDPVNRKTQMNTLVDTIRGIIPKDTPLNLQWEYHNFLYEIVHDWYRAGLIYFGRPDDVSYSFPWITITDYGKECIESGNLLPYDPEGYISSLQSKVPQIDPVTLTYLKESISTYNREHNLSSAITLGVASENMVLLLVETFVNSISNPQKQTQFSTSVTDKSIYKKYQLFMAELKKYIGQLPGDLTLDLEAQLDTIFNFIRITRNQAGHPTGTTPSRKVIYSNLQIFAEYSKRVFDLIGYFSKNKI